MKSKNLLFIAIIGLIIQVLNISLLVNTYPVASIIISSIVIIAAFTSNNTGAIITFIAIVAGIFSGFVFFYVASAFAMIGIVSAFASSTACGVDIVNKLNKESNIKNETKQ